MALNLSVNTFRLQAHAKERVLRNTEVGRGLVSKMGQEASTPEMDKYNLHVEEVNTHLLWLTVFEQYTFQNTKIQLLLLFLSKQYFCQVDKITSLILGLSSRLAKTENTLANLKRGTWDEDEEVTRRSNTFSFFVDRFTQELCCRLR